MNQKILMALIGLSAIVVMVFGINDVFARPLSAVLLFLYTVFPLVVVGFGGVGFTKRNIRNSILAGIVVGIVYGIIRGLFLRFIPDSKIILGADLALISPRLETGIQLGPVMIRGFWMSLLGVFLMPLFIGIESYFRGFVFLNLKKHIPWPWAIVVVSAVQSIARRTPHSLIMGSIGGVLMQKYDNIWAPIFFHGFQFFVGLAVVVA